MTTIYGGEPMRYVSGPRPPVRFALTDEAKAAGLPFPTKAHDSDAGFDLCALSMVSIYAPRIDDAWLIDTGVCVAIPPGYCGLIRERSSWAKNNLMITGGVIDASYRGSIKVVCYGYHAARRQLVRDEQFPRFAQLLIVPIWTGGVEYVDSLDETERGAGGFGSTGQG